MNRKSTRNAGTRRRTASRKCTGTAVPSAPPAPRPPLSALAPEEFRIWIRATRSALDRRAHRGIPTLTDDTYEQDSLLEDDLLALLDELEARQ